MSCKVCLPHERLMAFRAAASVGTRSLACRTPSIPRITQSNSSSAASRDLLLRCRVSSWKPQAHLTENHSNLCGWKSLAGTRFIGHGLVVSCLEVDFPQKLGRSKTWFVSSRSKSGGRPSCNAASGMVVNKSESEPTKRKLPVLLFDVMDTLIRDPFFEDMPKFFKLTLKELFAVKHPTAWIEFEKGLISETELLSKFFKDGRDFDLDGLKGCAYDGYRWIEGCEEVLRRLQEAGYEAHAFTNYPHWYQMIEEKLSLSRYLDWTFVSCHTGRRKPDLEAFMEAASTLGLHPEDCVFIDDRPKNVEAAQAAGMAGILFTDASSLESELRKLGVKLEPIAQIESSGT